MATIYTYKGLDIDLDRFPEAVVREHVVRSLKHILGSEVSSKLVAERDRRAKAGEAALDEDGEAAFTNGSRVDFVESMYAGQWGTGSRAPRAVAADRETAIYQSLLNKAVREQLAKMVKAGNLVETTVDGEKAWTNGKSVVTFSQWVERFLANPALGSSREAKLREEAAERFAAEKRAKAVAAERAKAEAGGAPDAELDYI